MDGVDFAIEPGEVFGLLGPNGAGKSTTISIIATLLAADEGRVTVRGIDSSDPDYKRLLGYVPQEISLADRLTGRENLAFIGKLYDLRGSDLKRRVSDTLDAVGLSDRANDLVSKYSGGMKRRLHIGAGLLHKPALILMDEPTAGVDPQARAYIFEIVEKLAADGRSVLYTTHYMEEAQRLCHRTAIIDHGKLLAVGTLSELVKIAATRRELLIESDEMTDSLVAALAKELGDRSWKLDDGVARVDLAHSSVSLMDAIRASEKVGLHVKAISIGEPNLETVFLDLTGRSLRD